MADNKLKFILDFIIKNKKDLEDVEKTMKDLPKQTNETSKSTKTLGQRFKSASGAITAVSTAYMAVSQALGAAIAKSKEYIKAFFTQENAERRLEKQLGKNIDAWKNYASGLQQITTTGDETTLSLIATADALGVQEENYREVVEGSIGLAESFADIGLSQETALKGIANAYQGNFEQLQRYIPALKNAETEAEKMTILQENMSQGFLLATDAANYGEGQLIQYQNAVGDLQEQIGGLAFNAFAPLIEHMKRATVGATEFIQNQQRISAIKEETSTFERQAVILEQLWSKQDKTNSEKERQQELIEEMQAQYPDLLANIDDEGISWNEVAKGIDGVIESLENKLVLEMMSQETVKLQRESVNLRIKENELIDNQAVAQADLQNWLEKQNLEMENQANWSDQNLRSYGLINAKVQESERFLVANRERQKEISAEINETETAYRSLLETMSGGGDGGESGSEEVKKIVTELEAMQVAMRTINAQKLNIAVDIDPAILDPETEEIINVPEKIFGTEERRAELREQSVSHYSQMMETTASYTNQAMNLANNLYNLGKALRDQEMQDEIQSVLESSLAEEEKQAKIQNIKEKYQQKDIAAKKKLKPIKVAQAISNTALGVTKALSTGDILLSLLIGAVGAAEVATIMAQPYAKGGAIDKKGQVLRGSSHAAGGIPINAEGEEIILTKGVYRNPALRKAASDINQAGGGRSFAAGGAIAGQSRSVSAINGNDTLMRELIQEIRAMRMDIGDLRLSVTIQTTDHKSRIIDDEETRNNLRGAGDELENL